MVLKFHCTLSHIQKMAEERESGGEKGAQSSTDTSEGEARDATEEEKKKE